MLRRVEGDAFDTGNACHMFTDVSPDEMTLRTTHQLSGNAVMTSL